MGKQEASWPCTQTRVKACINVGCQGRYMHHCLLMKCSKLLGHYCIGPGAHRTRGSAALWLPAFRWRLAANKSRGPATQQNSKSAAIATFEQLVAAGITGHCMLQQSNQVTVTAKIQMFHLQYHVMCISQVKYAPDQAQ